MNDFCKSILIQGAVSVSAALWLVLYSGSRLIQQAVTFKSSHKAHPTRYNWFCARGNGCEWVLDPFTRDNLHKVNGYGWPGYSFTEFPSSWWHQPIPRSLVGCRGNGNIWHIKISVGNQRRLGDILRPFWCVQKLWLSVTAVGGAGLLMQNNQCWGVTEYS